VLIEGNSKKKESDWAGRNTQNKVVVFPKSDRLLKKGDYVQVYITSATAATLLGQMI
jgi:tRNA-2-methylthio-N6-dimethylallyladenosine synthase